MLYYNNLTNRGNKMKQTTKEKYNEMLESLNSIDLTRVVEMEDNTDLSGELACAGGACEIT